MSDLQNKVNRTVQGFVAEVIELVRHAAVETLHVAFADPAPTSAVARAAAGPATSPGRRRTAEDLEALARRVALIIRASPGLRISELGERLGTAPRRLTIPIRKLVAEGAIRAQGVRRATIYFAAAAPDPADERGAEPVPMPAGFDEGWHRCLAGVIMLAHKLEK